MKSLALYHKLAINIQRQRTKQLEVRDAKAGSNGWVACFNEDAAKMIVEILKTKTPSDYICATCPNLLYKKWTYDFAMKDMRRASLYWLGHNTATSQNQLMKHARHASYETTLKYLRRPDEDVGEFTELALDA